MARETTTKNAPRLPTLGQYLLGFFLFTALGLGLFAAFVWRDLHGLTVQMRTSDRALAAGELEQARLLLAHRVDDLVAALESWDEVRAQLEDPAYYAYWRDSRATAYEDLPLRPQDLELYDVSGRPLAREPSPGLPAIVEDNGRRAWVARQGDRVYAHFTAPLVDGDRHRPMGYVVVRFILPDTLLTIHPPRYLDGGSLRLRVPPGVQVPYGALLQYADFSARPNPYETRLTELAHRAGMQLALGLLLVLALAYFLVRSLLLKPLQRLSGHLEALRAGHASLLAGEAGRLRVRETELLREALNDYQLRLEQLHGDLANKNQELWRMAHHDPLTGVFNRRALEDDWRQMLASAGSQQLPVSLTLFDCDHFKAINDTYGHHVGDEVIQALARCLKSALRGNDRLYRLGGDEFATVLWNTPAEEAARLAQRCLEAVASHDFTVHGVKEPVRMSAGIAEARSLDENTRLELQRRADLAMYEAKRPGAGKIVVYSETLEDRQALLSHPETHAVWRAMHERERLELHYQPVFDVATGALSHYEALLRIRDGERLVLPSVILPLVEMRGCECELDLAVLDRLEQDLQTGRIPAGTGVAFNVSGPGIVQSRVVERVLALAGFLPQCRLVLEITETSLITRITEASDYLARLREAGFTIALDDFGNGYSSLRYLAHMPVDFVKFDREMVQALRGQDRQAVLVRDLARLIADAGYRLVAEGIESEDMLEAVRAAGFHQAQGYHLGRPAPLTSGH